MCGLRYGTLPVVRSVGGLADTVIDLDGGAGATGFVFDAATPAAFERCVLRARQTRRDLTVWSRLMRQAMSQTLSWAGPASDYLQLYSHARHARGKLLTLNATRAAV
jgi:starch synthase